MTNRLPRIDAAVAIMCMFAACSKDNSMLSFAANAGGPGAGTATVTSGTAAAAGMGALNPALNPNAAGSGSAAAGTGTQSGSAGTRGGAGTAANGGGQAGAGAMAGTAAMSDDDAGLPPIDAGASDSGGMMPASTQPAADYTKPGPYGPTMRVLNVAMGSVSGGSSALIPLGNSNDASAFTLFFPKGGKQGEKFPILTFGNGTLCSPTFYDEFINHVVSYGYIVIAPNTSNTGTGAEMLQGVEWVIKQNSESSSPIFGKVNTDKVGAFGHSQGGAGTCRAGADPRVDAIATLSGTSDVANIKCPAFFVTSGGEAGDAPDERIQSTLGAATKPSMYGISVGGNHDEYTDKADEGVTAVIGLTSNDGEYSRAAVTAWFDWQLKDMQNVGQLFLSKPCAFCNSKNLKRLDLKGF